MHKKIMKLPVIRELSPGVTLRTLGELDIIVIDNAFCQAALSLQGAHLLLWQPSTQKCPVLWLSKCSSFKKGDPIRGGISDLLAVVYGQRWPAASRVCTHFALGG